MKYKHQLEMLRQRIPVGLNHALKLLEKTKGDWEKAEKEFEAEMIVIIIGKTEVAPDIAMQQLIKNRFDIAATIRSIEEERYTLTELILRKCKDRKEEALGKVMYAVEEENKLLRNFWLNYDDLKTLPEIIYCFMTIMEWLNYESWEDYRSALSFHLDIVTIQIENGLMFSDLSESLQKANHIYTQVYNKNKPKNTKDWMNARDELNRHKEFQNCEEYFAKQRPILIERLYELVKNNINKFP